MSVTMGLSKYLGPAAPARQNVATSTGSCKDSSTYGSNTEDCRASSGVLPTPMAVLEHAEDLDDVVRLTLDIPYGESVKVSLVSLYDKATQSMVAG